MYPPRLPPELEKEIFETFAFFYPEAMPDLLLVAQRVKIWIEPLLYRVLSIYQPGEREPRIFRHPCPVLDKLKSKTPPAFWRPEHVRYVLFNNGFDSSAAFMLKQCTNVVNLAISGAFPADSLLLLPLVPTLRRLSIRINSVLSPVARKFTHPFFAHLTHLDILDRADEGEGWDAWSSLAQLPSLTHLSFHENFMPRSVCTGALHHCEKLAVLVLVWPSHEARLDTDHAYIHLDYEHPRFVMIAVPDLLEDWETGARGGEDYWDVADKLVKQRHLHGTMHMPAFLEKIYERAENVCETIAKIETQLKVYESHPGFAYQQQTILLRHQIDALRHKVNDMKHCADDLSRSRRLAMLETERGLQSVV